MTDRSTQKLQAVRRRIEAAPIEPEDREQIEEFDRGLRLRKQTGDRMHASHLHRLLIVARCRAPPGKADVDDDDPENVDPTQYHGVALADALVDREAATELDHWIERRTWEGDLLGEKTKGHFRTTLRVFGRVMTDHGPKGDDVPPSLRHLYGGDARNKEDRDPAPKPSEISWWDPHVIYVIEEGCLNPRDRALVAVAWDSGARPEEVIDLTFGDVEYDGDFYRITVGSKDHPERDPLIAVATPYLRRWLQFKHPANDTAEGFSADTPIWTSLDDVEQLEDSSLRHIFQRIRGRIDYGKPLTLKWLRKSRASIVAMRENIGQTQLEIRFGWETGSQVAAHYIARFGDETSADIARGDGVPEEFLERTSDDRDDPAPVSCPDCEEWTPRHRDSCMWCAAEFDHEAAEEADVAVMLQDDVEYRETRDRVVREVIEDPSIAEHLGLGVEHGDFLHGNERIEAKLIELAEIAEEELSD